MTWTSEMRAEAAAFERKTVFIAIDAPAPGGRMLRRFVGEIVAFTPRGVFVRLLDGRGVDLPPDLSAYSWASPGAYPLSGIPACVPDPDVVTAWMHHDDGGLSRAAPPLPLRDDEWEGPLKLLVGLHNDPADQGFDPLRARALTGKTVIVSVRYVNVDGVQTDRKQFFGRVRSFDEHGASIEHDDGTTMFLPPVPSGFRWARPGRYTLLSCGRDVQNPDALARLASHEHATSSEPELYVVAPDEPGDEDEGEVVA